MKSSNFFRCTTKYRTTTNKPISIYVFSNFITNKENVYSIWNSFNKNSLGIIRNRYINVPIYNYKREEKTALIKEEHLLTTNKYVLTIGTPEAKKEKVLRKSLVTT